MSVPSPKDAASAAPDLDVAAPPAATGKSGDTDPLIGKVISDRFRIISPIARGGMGVVYKAEQAPLGRLVAIKILSLKHDEQKDPEFRKRFFLEAATVAKLTHPNTVTVFDYGQGDAGSGSQGIYYIAMELVNGRTLKKALAEEGPFDAERTINIAKQICRSLREAHRLGVIHRDMKPGNVMLVDRDGEDYVKVLDFGLVKELEPAEGAEEDLTQAGVFMGSPKYMAPEQIQGEQVDGRSDIYAIGVMMYEMLCGRVPFNRDNPMQILMDHVREPVPAMVVPQGAAPVPPELQAIILKCLEKKKEQRYADMEALLVALRTGDGAAGRLVSSSQSRETDLALSGAGTPVSGVHSLAAGASSPAAGMPPAITMSTSGAMPVAPSVPPGAASIPAQAPRSSMPMVIGIVAVLVTIGGVAAFAMGGGDEAADVGPVASAPHDRGAGDRGPGDRAPGDHEPERAGDPDPAGEPTPGAGGTAVAPVDPGASTTDTQAPPGPVEPVRTLMLSLRSFPAGATVRIGDREYGPTPTQVELVGELAADGAQLEMVFERAGYRSTTLTETVHGATLEVNARLAPIRRAGGEGAGSGGTGAGGDTHVEGYRDSPY